jgi:predicted transposase/invertase (TIGR01784 family)
LDNASLKKALHVLDVLNFSDEERALYEDHLKWLRIEANTLKKTSEQALEEGIAIGKQEGIAIGESIGIEKGIEKGKGELIKMMLNQGNSVDTISKITGLPASEIQKLL